MLTRGLVSYLQHGASKHTSIPDFSFHLQLEEAASHHLPARRWRSQEQRKSQPHAGVNSRSLSRETGNNIPAELVGDGHIFIIPDFTALAGWTHCTLSPQLGHLSGCST